MKRTLQRMFTLALAASTVFTLEAAENNTPAATPQQVEQAVRHQLIMLPYYNVFDNLAYKVNGGTVTLLGQVTWPAVKNDAEAAVKTVPGVTKVINDIHVLPPSPMDDRIRMAELRHIYSAPGFERYADQPIPSIHIIVENGYVTLDGVVGNKADRQIAYMRAMSVPGTFGVTNNLQVVEG